MSNEQRIELVAILEKAFAIADKADDLEDQTELMNLISSVHGVLNQELINKRVKGEL